MGNFLAGDKNAAFWREILFLGRKSVRLGEGTYYPPPFHADRPLFFIIFVKNAAKKWEIIFFATPTPHFSQRIFFFALFRSVKPGTSRQEVRTEEFTPEIYVPKPKRRAEAPFQERWKTIPAEDCRFDAMFSSFETTQSKRVRTM